MNKSELKEVLVGEQFRGDTYSLEPGVADEALCLREENGKWCVYYSERGLQTGKVFFTEEFDVCDYFLTTMRADPTTKKNWKSGFSL